MQLPCQSDGRPREKDTTHYQLIGYATIDHFGIAYRSKESLLKRDASLKLRQISVYQRGFQLLLDSKLAKKLTLMDAQLTD